MRRFIALVAVIASAPALAQEDRGPYIGLGLGQVDYEDNLLNWFDVSDTDMASKLIVGFRFNETLLFEANTSSADFSKNYAGNVNNFADGSGNFGGGDYTAVYTGEFDVTELRVLAHLKYMVFGISYFFSDFSARLVGDSTLGSFDGRISDSDNGYSIIIGAQWDIGRWGIRPEYEYFDVSSPADATSLGVQVHFGF